MIVVVTTFNKDMSCFHVRGYVTFVTGLEGRKEGNQVGRKISKKDERKECRKEKRRRNAKWKGGR